MTKVLKIAGIGVLTLMSIYFVDKLPTSSNNRTHESIPVYQDIVVGTPSFLDEINFNTYLLIICIIFLLEIMYGLASLNEALTNDSF